MSRSESVTCTCEQDNECPVSRVFEISDKLNGYCHTKMDSIPPNKSDFVNLIRVHPCTGTEALYRLYGP